MNDVRASKPQTTVTTVPDAKTSEVSILTVAPRGILSCKLPFCCFDLARALIPRLIPIIPKLIRKKRETSLGNLRGTVVMMGGLFPREYCQDCNNRLVEMTEERERNKRDQVEGRDI